MTAKKKVYKLKLEMESDFQLIGIASHENDYRLSWALNQGLGFKLVKSEDLKVNHIKHKLEIPYSHYSFIDEIEYMNFSLISNKSEKGFLLPDKKNIDFILKVSGDQDIDYLSTLVNRIKKVDIIITAFLLTDLSDKAKKMFEY